MQQETDDELNQIKDKQTGLKLLKVLHNDIVLTCDVSTNTPRPFIPLNFRKLIFDQTHQLSHSGIKATTALIKKNFVRPSMTKDIQNWCKGCIPCQQTKVHKHVKTKFQQIDAPNERFEHVHIDIIGPLPSSEGFTHCITCIDRFSRWPEAIPITDTKAETVAKAFFLQWIARFGVPLRLTTDRGVQFESELFSNLNRLLGINKLHTTAYHPQANGILERWHRTLKNAIKSHVNHKWIETLPTILLGLRSIILENLNASPAEFVYGSTIRLPFNYFETPKQIVPANQHNFVERLKEMMKDLQPVPSSNKSKQTIFIHKALNNCTHVFIRNDGVKKSLQPNYDGPYEVISRQPKYFLVKVKGHEKQISIDRLKPMFTVNESFIQIHTPTSDKKLVRFRT